MTREEEALKNSILKVLQVYIKEITLESRFSEDLGADSIDLVQVFKLTEEELNIKVPSVDLAKVVTVRDALALFSKHAGK